MRYIILIFIGILLITTGFAINANAEITSYSVPTEQTDVCKNKPDYNKYKNKHIGTLSNGYKVYVSNNSIPCVAGQVGRGYVLYDITTLTLEVLIHENVHVAQHEGGGKEKEARNTTKFFFETLQML